MLKTEYIADNIQDIAAAVRRSIERKENEEKASSLKGVTEEMLSRKMEILLEMRMNREITADEYKRFQAEKLT